MKSLKTFALAAVVATTIGAGSLVAAAPAHAAPLARIKCSDAITLANAYIRTGDAWMAAGSPVTAAAWYGKAEALTLAAC